MTAGAGKAGDMDARLAAVLAGARVFVDVPIHRTTVVAKMRLLERGEEEAISLELARWVAGLGVDERHLLAVGGLPIASRRALLTIAVAVRSQKNPEEPFLSLEQWAKVDDTVIGALYRRYEDLVEELNPWRADELEAGVASAIRAAIEKKSPASLLAFGASKLVRYMISTGVPPAASETPR